MDNLIGSRWKINSAKFEFTRRFTADREIWPVRLRQSRLILRIKSLWFKAVPEHDILNWACVNLSRQNLPLKEPTWSKLEDLAGLGICKSAQTTNILSAWSEQILSHSSVGIQIFEILRKATAELKRRDVCKKFDHQKSFAPNKILHFFNQNICCPSTDHGGKKSSSKERWYPVHWGS